MKVLIGYGEVDKVVVKEIKHNIEAMLSKNYDIHEHIDKKAELLSAMFKVLEYYLPPSEYEDFRETLVGKKLKGKQK